MKTVPRHLFTNEIRSFIDEMISYENAKDFSSLDEIHQDKFVALCIRALGCDVEIVLGSEGAAALVNFLLTYDRDHEIDVMQALKDSVREQFSFYFDELLAEEKADRFSEEMHLSGKSRIVDQTNGEVRWI